MVKCADEDLSVCDLCVATGVSWRTLDRGFREEYGVGPKACFKRLKLTCVRALLLQGRAVGNVLDAANALGFWRMEQFARDYRQMFGELPSTTRAD